MGKRTPRETRGNRTKNENKFNPIELERHTGIKNDWLDELGNSGVVITPPGAVDPWDCKRWPNSPYCDGGFDPENIIPGIDEISVSVSECEIIVTVEWSFGGFSYPSFTIGYRFPECDEEKPEIPKQLDPVAPRPEPINLNEIQTNWGCPYAVYFCYPGIDGHDELICLYAWGPISDKMIEHTFLYDPDTVYILRKVSHYGYIFGYISPYLDQVPYEDRIILPLIGVSTGWRGLAYGRFDNSTGFYEKIAIEESQFVDRTKYTVFPPRLQPMSVELIPGTDWSEGIASNEGQIRIMLPNSYPFAIKAIDLPEAKSVWHNCNPTYKRSRGLPYPRPQLNMNCCEETKELLRLNAIRLKKLIAINQPEKFCNFDGEGNVTKVVGKFPRSLLFPDATGYNPIAGYDDAISNIFNWLDRTLGHWPSTAVIKDSDPNKEGDQPAINASYTVSDAFKNLKEAVAGLIILTQKREEKDTDRIIERLLTSILLEAGITHRIAAKIDSTVDNMEEYMDYKIRQQEVELPMAFNPLVPVPEQPASDDIMESWVNSILKPSTVPLKITELDYKNQTKLLPDLLREILKHSSTAAGAVGVPIRSKTDLTKVIENARMLAQVGSALDIQKFKTALGLPASTDLSEFADEIETGFYPPNDNVETVLHSESQGENATRPSASDRAKIRRITKGGKRKR